MKHFRILNPNLSQSNAVGIEKEKVLEDLHWADFLIACQESEALHFFETINRLCLQSCTRWMRVSIEGTTAFLGPTLIPYQTACYNCYQRRVESNLPDYKDYSAYKEKLSENAEAVETGYFHPLWTLLSSHVAIELARILTGFAPPQTLGRLYQFQDLLPSPVGHDVLRLPRCPVCGVTQPKFQAWDDTGS